MAPPKVALGAAIALALALPASATSSQMIARNATDVKLAVAKGGGAALLTYKVAGKKYKVALAGAINARHPTPGKPQVQFKTDYSGGYKLFGKSAAGKLKNACRPYNGPKLAWLVTACRATDGSFWAVQSWQRMLPNLGRSGTPAQAVWELRISHWKGTLPSFSVALDVSARGYDRVFGFVAYRGRAVHGFRHTASGVPLDSYGRNVYLDTYSSAYGTGWKRELSFLLAQPTGAFCHTMYPEAGRPNGKGQAYRATVIGPGVMPDLMWESTAAAASSAERARARGAEPERMVAASSRCG